MTAYNETCAAVGNDFWNHRLFPARSRRPIHRRDGAHALQRPDFRRVARRQNTFFYPNPLESNGQHQRSPMVRRGLLSFEHHALHGVRAGIRVRAAGDAIWVNLYMAFTGRNQDGQRPRIGMVQETRYPWDGAVKICGESRSGRRRDDSRAHPRMGAQRSGAHRSLSLRRSIPRRQATIKVNGRVQPMKLDRGYVVLTRTWKQGDTIELNLPMPVRRVAANEQVAADRGRVALQRGPLVFAAEWVDNPGGKVRNLVLPDSGAAARRVPKPALLKGVEVVTARAVALSRDEKGHLIRTPEDITFIPYHAWANRGPGQMMVWIPNSESTARPAPPPRPHLRTPRSPPVEPETRTRSKPTMSLGLIRRPRSPLRLADRRPLRPHRLDRVFVSTNRPPFPKPLSIGSTTPATAPCACPPRGGCSIATATPGNPLRPVGAYGVDEGPLQQNRRFRQVTATALQPGSGHAARFRRRRPALAREIDRMRSRSSCPCRAL
jgi:hypothetical protein